MASGETAPRGDGGMAHKLEESPSASKDEGGTRKKERSGEDVLPPDPQRCSIHTRPWSSSVPGRAVHGGVIVDGDVPSRLTHRSPIV